MRLRGLGLLVAVAMLAGAGQALAADLVIWHGYRGEEKIAFEKVVAMFNEKMAAKGVKATTLAVPYDAFADKITASVPRGKGPDIFIFAQDRLGGWIESGNTIDPLDFYLEKGITDRFLPVTMDAMTYKGQIWGLPFNFKCVTMIYNKKLVSTPPKTSKELVALAQKLTNAAAGQYGLAYTYADFYFHSALMNAFGGQAFDAQRKPTVNNPNNIKSLELLMKWFDQDKILPAEPGGALITQLFNSGKAAMVFNGPWFLGEISKDIDYGLAHAAHHRRGRRHADEAVDHRRGPVHLRVLQEQGRRVRAAEVHHRRRRRQDHGPRGPPDPGQQGGLRRPQGGRRPDPQGVPQSGQQRRADAQLRGDGDVLVTGDHGHEQPHPQGRDAQGGHGHGPEGGRGAHRQLEEEPVTAPVRRHALIGVAVAALAGVVSAWFLLGAGRRATVAFRAEREIVVGAQALAELVTRAGLQGDQVRQVVAAFTAGDPAIRSVRVIVFEGLSLEASTFPEDVGDKAAPRRLQKEEKPLYDQGQRLRAAADTNREDQASMKEEIEVTPMADRSLDVAVPLSRDGEVVGFLQFDRRAARGGGAGRAVAASAAGVSAAGCAARRSGSRASPASLSCSRWRVSCS